MTSKQVHYTVHYPRDAMQFMTWQRVTEVIKAIWGGVIIFIILQPMNSYDCTIVLMQAMKAYE